MLIIDDGGVKTTPFAPSAMSRSKMGVGAETDISDLEGTREKAFLTGWPFAVTCECSSRA
jgi:hypothetical protein